MRDEGRHQAAYIAESVLEALRARADFDAAGDPVSRGSFFGAGGVGLASRDIPFVKFGGLKFLEASREGFS